MLIWLVDEAGTSTKDESMVAKLRANVNGKGVCFALKMKRNAVF
jgi:hypothetical protein